MPVSWCTRRPVTGVVNLAKLTSTAPSKLGTTASEGMETFSGALRRCYLCIYLGLLQQGYPK
jgi:hypothetical protein